MKKIKVRTKGGNFLEEGISLLLVLLLILLNGFFVAAEFAVVKIRPTRVEQLIKENNRKALYVQKVINRLDYHLSGAQLGITLTSLGIGYMSEPAIARILSNLLSLIEVSPIIIHAVSFIIAFLIATFLHITIGEQVPKMWAIEDAEKMSLRTAKPLYWFCKITAPLIKVLTFSTDKILKGMGVNTRSEHEVHSEEEIKIILSNSPEIEPEEQEMFERILSFNDRLVREVMVHRTEMNCIYLNDSLEDNIQLIQESKYSRFPVCGEDKDDILGYINIRDLYGNSSKNINFKDYIREVPRIMESNQIPKVLKMMQKDKQQFAIVMDEYGGVSGLVTMEDIVEEIFGSIQDEFDEEEEEFSEVENGFVLDGGMLLDQANEILGTKLIDIDGIDTIGGYVLNHIEEPREGMLFDLPPYNVVIQEMEGHRIKSLSFVKKMDSLKVKEKMNKE